MIFGTGESRVGKSKHTEEQIIGSLKEVEAGRTVDDVARDCCVSQATIYAWKAKYRGMEVSDAQKLRSLEDGLPPQFSAGTSMRDRRRL